jgi:dethiobiotin synthetase
MTIASHVPGLFVTATDTNVGKTHIAQLMVRSLRETGIRPGVYKPACSGAIVSPSGVQWDDIERLRTAAGQDWPDDAICPQRFLAPLAPPIAAHAEGRIIDAQLLVTGADWWRGRVDFLVVEGAGGLLAPMTTTDSVADIASRLGYPLVIIARCGLGTINHTLLTVEAARHRGLKIAGVVLNQAASQDDLSLAESNATEIETRGKVSVLGILDWQSSDGLHRHGRPVTIRWSDFAAN